MATLTHEQIQQFITDGFVRIDAAFPQAQADAGRALVWKDTGCDPQDRATWTRPVIRLGQYAGEPFRSAANTQALHGAFDDRQRIGIKQTTLEGSAQQGKQLLAVLGLVHQERRKTFQQLGAMVG